MHPSAYDLKSFYNSRAGRIVRRIVRERMEQMWPSDSLTGLRLMGYGYPIPYLKTYLEKAERAFALMPGEQGVHHWPTEGGNLTCLSEERDLPFETNSVDRILMIHALEFTGNLRPLLQEMWRVLKSSGRILIVVPNRLGLWARADWSPFGRGTPCSATQAEDILRANLFVHERTEKALFVPPFRGDFVLRSAGFFEKVGNAVFPAMGGVHFIEASKQLYAPGTGKPVYAHAAPAKTRAADIPTTAAREAEREGV